MIKKLNLVLLAAPLLAVSTMASAEFSANFGVTSNYLWRGVTQSDNSPSVSGGLDISTESGLYAGTWIGTIDWGQGGGYENDYYFGYSGESNGFGYDVGYIYYAYPEEEYDDSNFGELYFNGSLGAFGFGVAYTVNSDADDDVPFGTGDLYYSVSYGFELPDDYGLGLTLGHYDFDVPSSAGDVDYTHVQVDLTKGDFTFSVSKATEDSGDDDMKIAVSWGASF
ncbi:TorF family putative porin [Neptunicella sp. SCSIO 80796]|uniref:TorF family putative porin n=1 Tax=Neptunicella plasticusilytica TaxID=3117012 RepID=UPI003A4D4262